MCSFWSRNFRELFREQFEVIFFFEIQDRILRIIYQKQKRMQQLRDRSPCIFENNGNFATEVCAYSGEILGYLQQKTKSTRDAWVCVAASLARCTLGRRVSMPPIPQPHTLTFSLSHTHQSCWLVPGLCAWCSACMVQPMRTGVIYVMQCPLHGDGKSEATSCGRTSLLERCQ